MLIVFITIIFISILLLFSLKYLKKRFDPFEIFLLFMFTSYSSQTFFYLWSSPYDFYDTVDRNSGELMDIFLQNIVYPGTVLFMMNYYKK